MRRCYKAAGVPHTAACRDWIERTMGDVGNPRLETVEEHITEFIAEKIAEGDLRTQAGSSGAGNPIQAEEECIGVPCVPSESDGKHPHSSSSSSSACAPTSDIEVRPTSDNDLDDRDAKIDYFCPDLTKEQTIEANETYELLSTFGADVGVARTIVAGLLSSQIFGVSNVQHVSGCGKMWNLHNEESATSVGRARGTRGKFAMMRGVRQECPASGFLFTMAFDPVYRWLMTDSFPLEQDRPWFLQRVAYAYADDYPLAMGFLRGALPIAVEAFEEIDEVKGMG